MAINKVIGVGVLTDDTKKIINDNFTDFSRASAQTSVSNSTALVNATGLVTGTLQPGTYRVRMDLIMTSGASGGTKIALKFGTASMLTSVQLKTKAFTTAAVATTTFTTATDAASIVAATAANTAIEVVGTIVVALAGTLQLQVAQNVSDGTATTIEVGSTMEFTAIGATTPLAGALI